MDGCDYFTRILNVASPTMGSSYDCSSINGVKCMDKMYATKTQELGIYSNLSDLRAWISNLIHNHHGVKMPWLGESRWSITERCVLIYHSDVYIPFYPCHNVDGGLGNLCLQKKSLGCLNRNTVFRDIGIPMLKIRQSRDRPIFNKGITILVRRHLYIATPPDRV